MHQVAEELSVVTQKIKEELGKRHGLKAECCRAIKITPQYFDQILDGRRQGIAHLERATAWLELEKEKRAEAEAAELARIRALRERLEAAPA